MFRRKSTTIILLATHGDNARRGYEQKKLIRLFIDVGIKVDNKQGLRNVDKGSGIHTTYSQKRGI